MSKMDAKDTYSVPSDDIVGNKFLLRREENVAPRPIQSIDTYISLDAECIVAGSSDKHLRFLETDTLEEIAACTVSKRSVNCVAVSDMSIEGDDPVIITGGKDSKIQIWDPASAQMERTMEVPTDEVRSLDIYQGSETFVLIGTRDAKVILWDMRKDQLKWMYEGHRASIHSVSITSAVSDIENDNDLDYLCIASGGADRTVRTWCFATGKKMKKFRHLRSISCMAVANKGVRPVLATAGVERVIYLWDIETGIMINSLRGHLDQINSLSLWEGFQLLLISGSSDRTIRIYDVVSSECICILIGHDDSILGTTICDYDRPKLVSCSDDLSLIQWDLQAIIKEFYFVEGEQEGARNTSVPPLLPLVNYEAPEELDRHKLSKAERKELRRQIKREKRKKRYIQYLASKGLGKEERDGRLSPCSVDSAGYDSEEMERELKNIENDFQNEIMEEVQQAETVSNSSSPLTQKVGSGPNLVIGTNRIVPDPSRSSPLPASPSIRTTSVNLLKNVMSSIRIGSNKVAIDPATVEFDKTSAHMNNFSRTQRNTRRPSFGSESQKARILANQLESKYNIAVVEQQLAHERSKEQAKAKLAMRLKRKKLVDEVKGDNDAMVSASTSAKQSCSDATLSKGPSMEAGKAQSFDATTHDLAELESLKQEKLRQHKMQEMRRNNSMAIAKERSGLALQKRLEEMAAKRTANKTLSATKEDDEQEEDSD